MYRQRVKKERLNKNRIVTPFDPEPAAKLAKELLDTVNAPFAVIGRIAVWAYLPPEAQEFTKDIDIAVPTEFIIKLLTKIESRS